MECYFMKYFCNVTDARSCHDQGFVGMRFHGKPIIFYVLIFLKVLNAVSFGKELQISLQVMA